MWQDLIESGLSGYEMHNAIIDHLGFSFSSEIVTQMKPYLLKSLKDLEEAVINYDAGAIPPSRMKKQISIAKDTAIKNGFVAMKTIKVEDERLLMYELVTIILLAVHPEKCKYKYVDREALLSAYPEFESIDESVEIEKLRAFANFMNFSFYFITPKYNRQHVFNIVTKITEGKDVKYVTGSGKTQCTANRVLIYNREGGIIPKPRPIRKNVVKNDFNINTNTQNNIIQEENNTILSNATSLADVMQIPMPMPNIPMPSMPMPMHMTMNMTMNMPMNMPTTEMPIIDFTPAHAISNNYGDMQVGSGLGKRNREETNEEH